MKQCHENNLTVKQTSIDVHWLVSSSLPIPTTVPYDLNTYITTVQAWQLAPLNNAVHDPIS